MEDIEHIKVLPLEVWYKNNLFAQRRIKTVSERIALAQQVRAGNCYAREDLILSLSPYVEQCAWKYHERYHSLWPRIEYVDLAQLGMLHVIEILDQALAKYEDPYPYLFVAIRREIFVYCYCWCSSIRVPETRKNNNFDAIPHATVSIEAEEIEIQEAPPAINKIYTELYEAVASLSGRYKEVIERRFGLNGYPPHSLPQISTLIGSVGIAGSYQALALKKLRNALHHIDEV